MLIHKYKKTEVLTTNRRYKEMVISARLITKSLSQSGEFFFVNLRSVVNTGTELKFLLIASSPKGQAT